MYSARALKNATWFEGKEAKKKKKFFFYLQK